MTRTTRMLLVGSVSVAGLAMGQRLAAAPARPGSVELRLGAETLAQRAWKPDKRSVAMAVPSPAGPSTEPLTLRYPATPRNETLVVWSDPRSADEEASNATALSFPATGKLCGAKDERQSGSRSLCIVSHRHNHSLWPGGRQELSGLAVSHHGDHRQDRLVDHLRQVWSFSGPGATGRTGDAPTGTHSSPATDGCLLSLRVTGYGTRAVP